MNPASLFGTITDAVTAADLLSCTVRTLLDTHEIFESTASKIQTEIDSLLLILKKVQNWYQTPSEAAENLVAHIRLPLSEALEATKKILEDAELELSATCTLNDRRVRNQNRWSRHIQSISDCVKKLRRYLTSATDSSPKLRNHLRMAFEQQSGISQSNLWDHGYPSFDFPPPNSTSAFESSYCNGFKHSCDPVSVRANFTDRTSTSTYHLNRLSWESSLPAFLELSPASSAPLPRPASATISGGEITPPLLDTHLCPIPKENFNRASHALGSMYNPQEKMSIGQFKDSDTCAKQHHPVRNWGVNILELACAATTATVMYHYDKQRCNSYGFQLLSPDIQDPFPATARGMLFRTSPTAVVIGAIGLYSIATGCHYSRYILERRQDQWLVGSGTFGVILGLVVGLDSQSIVFRILPNMIILALIASTLISHASRTDLARSCVIAPDRIHSRLCCSP